MSIRKTSFDRTAGVVAVVAILCAAAWIAVNVWGNDEGRLSGLFYTGSRSALPPEITGHTYRVNDVAGYDGQFYHLIAHDPFLRRGYAAFVDNPPLRWRRIGVPALVWLFAFGDDRAIDSTYVAVQLTFVLLGAFWLSLYAQREQWNPAWGLAFLLIPAVLVSLDRMTVDLPLAALTIGLILYSPRRLAYLILCFAPLVRETGMVLLGAWCLHFALKREWRPAILGVAGALPAVAWWTYVHAHASADGTHWLAGYPFSGILDATLQGGHGPDPTLWLRAASAFEKLALAGVWLALALSVYLVCKRHYGLPEWIAIVFTAFAAALGRPDIWDSAYAAGRTMSPLLIALGIIALRDRRAVFAVPLLLMLPRVALQYEAQIRSALRG